MKSFWLVNNSQCHFSPVIRNSLARKEIFYNIVYFSNFIFPSSFERILLPFKTNLLSSWNANSNLPAHFMERTALNSHHLPQLHPFSEYNRSKISKSILRLFLSLVATIFLLIWSFGCSILNALFVFQTTNPLTARTAYHF